MQVYKYIEYVGILLWTIFRKLFGLLWIWVALPFRGYANNTVFNYVLQNEIYLKRLLEREPVLDQNLGGYTMQSKNHDCGPGFIKYRNISWLEYKLVYWILWGWLDADSTNDTYCSKAFFREFLGIHKESWVDNIQVTGDNGNTFDLGDNIKSCYCTKAVWIWTLRNTAYNFKYMQFETNKPRSEWFWIDVSKLGGTGFGNRPKDGRLEFGWF